MISAERPDWQTVERPFLGAIAVAAALLGIAAHTRQNRSEALELNVPICWRQPPYARQSVDPESPYIVGIAEWMGVAPERIKTGSVARVVCDQKVGFQQMMVAEAVVFKQDEPCLVLQPADQTASPFAGSRKVDVLCPGIDPEIV